LSGSTLPPSKEKVEHGASIWLRIHFKLIGLNQNCLILLRKKSSWGSTLLS